MDELNLNRLLNRDLISLNVPVKTHKGVGIIELTKSEYIEKLFEQTQEWEFQIRYRFSFITEQKYLLN